MLVVRQTDPMERPRGHSQGRAGWIRGITHTFLLVCVTIMADKWSEDQGKYSVESVYVCVWRECRIEH